MFRPFAPLVAPLAALALLAGCAGAPPKPAPPPPAACAPCVCPVCPTVEVPKPAAPPYDTARWTDLPGWAEADPADNLKLLADACATLARRPAWRDTCDAIRAVQAAGLASADLRAWLEGRLAPWQLVNPDGSREGLITGYFEPVLKGSRTRHPPYLQPIYGVPDDLLVVDLSSVYPELKGLRLRGRLDGRRVVPYETRAEIADEAAARAGQAILWVDDAIDLFFMQIQGSGQVELDDGSRVRVAYADQNGHPYRSIGRWLADHGELALERTSMQNIKAWARTHPARVQELLDANPSVVFFRELPVNGSGPPGALGLPLTPARSLAVDPRTTPLGLPVWLATTEPSTDTPLDRLMLAQDTGGAIRGPVRADFFWGSGPAAGDTAGRMRQQGRMWLLLPAGHTPQAPK